MSKSDIPEAYPQLQYSKGFGKCQNCGLTRKHSELVKESVGGVAVVHCKKLDECERMKGLRAQSESALATVPLKPLPEPEEKEILATPTFWNSSNPFPI